MNIKFINHFETTKKTSKEITNILVLDAQNNEFTCKAALHPKGHKNLLEPFWAVITQLPLLA